MVEKRTNDLHHQLWAYHQRANLTPTISRVGYEFESSSASSLTK